MIIQSFEDTVDFFTHGFDSYNCAEDPGPEIYEHYDIDGERAAAIQEFNDGFKRYDADYRA